ncbi:MAG: hypothetical protein M4579_004030 [Chaenotheca gracillima]|nr:MAG: hypothetical protein M4579_004030 [Chaenotheca gracillima]
MESKQIEPKDKRQYEDNIRTYFNDRTDRLNIVKTTTSSRGSTIDWVKIDSQGPIAAAPPAPGPSHFKSTLVAELDQEGSEKGPQGTIPVVRKNLDLISYTKSLDDYLSKTRGTRRGMPRIFSVAEDEPPAAQDTATHRYGSSQQAVVCYGGEGNLSYWDPHVETAGDFSLLQIGMINAGGQSQAQTVEAGWQVFQELSGDYSAHLFTYFTTNGYTAQGNGLGGYDTDVGGWVQVDTSIFPGSTFSSPSVIGGSQSDLPIKYQLYQGNWWFSCLGKWIGYYPASLFSPKGQLGNHADHIGFWGEVFDSTEVSGRTKTDMGSGQFPSAGWTKSAFMSNLKYQADAGATNMPDYNGSADIVQEDTDMYRIEPHFNSGSSWGSYAWVGGPGAG